MRPIDADKTIEKLDCLFKETDVKSLNFMIIGYNHAVADSIAVVKGQPTADVPDRKVGKWNTDKESPEYATCSVCGHCDWDCTESEYFNYCPNCGADMRGEPE